jgi:hypothetical protein
VFWILYIFFWVFPRRQIKFCRRFGTFCQVHLQRFDEEYEWWKESVVFIYIYYIYIYKIQNTAKFWNQETIFCWPASQYISIQFIQN